MVLAINVGHHGNGQLKSVPSCFTDAVLSKTDKRLRRDLPQEQFLKMVSICQRQVGTEVRILHFLEDPYRGSIISDFRFQCLGKFMPSTTQFDGVSKHVQRVESIRVHESSGAETSSSTSFEACVRAELNLTRGRLQLALETRHGVETRRQSRMMDVRVCVGW